MRRAGIVALVLGGAVAVAAIGAVGVDRLREAWPANTAQTEAADGRTPPREGTAGHDRARPPHGVPEDAEPAIVDRVVDGDTIRVITEPGGSIADGGSIRVRLLNIDTPELATADAPAECGATAAAARLEDLAAPGDLVWLAGDREDRDVHDRPLRGVFTDAGVFVNEVLAREGHAEVLLIAPNDRFHTTIVEAVDEAKSASRGIWGGQCGR